MSGGSMDYLYWKVRDVEKFFDDKRIKEMLIDISDLLHDREWYEDADICEGAYNKTELRFRHKWFKDRIDSKLFCLTCENWTKDNKTEDYGSCFYENNCLRHGYEHICNKYQRKE